MVEIRGRGGHLLERLRSERACLRVGRSFGNDIVIDDEYVSPLHLSIWRVENGWRVEDHESLNGYRHKTANKTTGGELIRSGDHLRIGQTNLYFYDSDHPVDEPLRLDSLEARISALASPLVWPLLIVLAVALVLGESYFASYQEFKFLPKLSNAIGSVVIVLAVAAFWAFVGRLLRHRATFFSHVSIWFLAALLSSASTHVAEVIAYNLHSDLVFKILDLVLGVITLALAFWASLYLAARLKRLPRAATAIGFAAAFMGITTLDQWRFTEEFSASPKYYGAIKQPIFRWARARSDDEANRLLDRLLIEADSEVSRLAEEDAELDD